MSIDESDAIETIEHGGASYHFCSEDCGDQFRDDPDPSLVPITQGALALWRPTPSPNPLLRSVAPPDAPLPSTGTHSQA